MLKVFDSSSLECRYIYSKIKSMTWTKRFYSYGSFTIVLSKNSPGKEYLTKNSIITFGKLAGIIKYRHQSETEIEIRGYDLKGLCKQRIVVPPFVYLETPTVMSGYDRIKDTPENVIRHYVEAHLINPTDTARKILNLEFLGNSHGYSGELAWQAKFTNLSEELEKICIYSQLGYDITFDESRKKLLFDVMKGNDKTGTDSNYGFVTFGEKYHNINSSNYTLDAMDEKNVCYVAASGEEEQQFVYESYNSEQLGINRAEGVETASGSDEDYVDEVQSKGLSYIKENKEGETIEAQTNNRFKYGTDWELGDFVTIAVKDCFGYDMEIKRQITEVVQTWNDSSYSAVPTFGEKKKSTLRKILRS